MDTSGEAKYHGPKDQVFSCVLRPASEVKTWVRRKAASPG